MVYRKQKKFNVGAANFAKKTICLLLVVCLAVVLMPQVALADEATLNGAAASNVEQVVNVQGDADLQSAATSEDVQNVQTEEAVLPSALYTTVDRDACVCVVDGENNAVSDEINVQANVRTQVASLFAGTYFLQYKDSAGTWVDYDKTCSVTVANNGVDVDVNMQLPVEEDAEVETTEEVAEESGEDIATPENTEPAISNEESAPSITEPVPETADSATQTQTSASTVTVKLGTVEGEVVELDIVPVKTTDDTASEQAELDAIDSAATTQENALFALGESFYSDRNVNSLINYGGYNNYMVCVNGDQPAWCSTPTQSDAPRGKSNAVTFDDAGWAGHAWDYLCCTGYPNTSFSGYTLTAQQSLSATAGAAWLLGTGGSYAPACSDRTVISAAYALYRDSLLYASYFADGEAGWSSMYKKAHYYTRSGYQTLVSLVAAHTGSLSVVKTSSNPTLTNGNDCYSLEGAVFGLYKDQASCAQDENITGTQGNHAYKLITTGKDGKAPEVTDLDAGTYYMRELVAPIGFKKIENAWSITITAGQTTTHTVTDTPIDDPDGVLLHKVNSKGEVVTAPGDATLEGAEYAFDYYAGYYNTVEEAKASGAPTRHWVLKTNSDGETSLRYITKTDHSLLVEDASDELFYDEAGFATMSLGTLVIYELEAPTGYLKSDASFIARYVQDDTAPSGGRWEGDLTPDDYNQGNGSVVATETQAFYNIEVYKTIQGVKNEASPKGIKFEVVYVGTNESEYGKTYATITIDETGHASTEDVFAEGEGLPAGTYEVREVESTVPAGIQLYSQTSKSGTNVVATVSFPGTYEPFDVARVDCVDYTAENVALEKVDIDTKEPISNVEFTLYKYTGELGMDDGSIATDPSTLDAHADYWSELEVLTTNEHGLATFANKPYGIYMMVETAANYKYLNSTETSGSYASADPLDTARIFKIDKNTPATLQTWEDELIQIETTVDKSTIDVTSAGLISKSKSDGGENLTNVGKETYSYDVAFTNGNTNTYADEYWVIDELNMSAYPYDLRVTKIYMPTVINDTAPTVHLLIRTNKSANDNWSASSVVAKEKENYHPFSLTDGTSRFDGSGWRYIGEYSSVASTSIDVTNLKLESDEYLTGICLYYGAVEVGFTSVDTLSYDVVATHELTIGTFIPNTATSHITRNWANRDGSIGGLDDNDEDSVVTTVISTFEMAYSYELLKSKDGHIGSLIAQTGDSTQTLLMLSIISVLIAGAALITLNRLHAHINVRKK